ncbi:ABC transporter related protein [Xylanimonas cellulosilytica DSM 15894]|uniref:ABC transporter related protein n=1 Tax=Xylanimonas cellulosilytica (strain DSM 15894 / JCM 12276 / CECT 5975 / KCTC 9989 / LMG 20990 / NBRC 107835 / XIL07) TaxID=446471 RepID=D1C009_XYLCX|nr:ATP-binding cassette domain-containing protein [Xylanimonas cellulosilytica]ACZ32137.1 ABC transporter related protein [Xylanimonas cellulosilytica DSM 15894]
MIRTRGLTKDFATKNETVHAVRGITLDVEPGELVAVLGPNGAGKTTTLRMLTTLIAPTSGTAEVAGHDVVAAPDAVRHAIGYVGQGNAAGHTQVARDEIVTQGVIYGLDRRAARRRADELLESLELTDLARRKVADLSGGQRRRLDVAMGLVHSPSLLFLDEPSTGLDPHNRANLWEHILRMRTDRPAGDPMTIVLTTHYLDEADAMAERVVVVDHGEVIADDTAEHLKSSLAGDRVVAHVPVGDVARFAELAANAPGTRAVQVSGDAVELRSADGPAAVPGLLRAADADGIVVATVQVHRPTLDDVFLALTGRSLRETSIHETATTEEAAA